MAGRHGNKHQLEAAELQEEQEDWWRTHGSAGSAGSGLSCFRWAECAGSSRCVQVTWNRAADWLTVRPISQSEVSTCVSHPVKPQRLWSKPQRPEPGDVSSASWVTAGLFRSLSFTDESTRVQVLCVNIWINLLFKAEQGIFKVKESKSLVCSFSCSEQGGQCLTLI